MVDFSFLNEEQLRAVAHPIGRPACLIAGAGSGKTATITARVAWLMENSVPPFRICCITFTNKAAGEIARRVGLAEGAPVESRPHISTIHSLALSAIRRDPEGFGFEGRVTPMDDYDQAQMCRKLIERMPQEMGVEMNAYRFLEKLAYHRARGVGFSDGYTEEVHEETLEHHKGYHALEDWEARLWKRFEEEKRCHPPGEKIEIVVERQHPGGVLGKRGGFAPARVESRRIESLKGGELAVSWRRQDGRTLYIGRPIKVVSRHYSGDMLTISTLQGSTRVTPDHLAWTRFNDQASGKHLVYLMYRSGFGFRVGITIIKKRGRGGTDGGLSSRMNAEGAEKGWVLRVCDSKFEARMWEEIYTVKYGIPQVLFEVSSGLQKEYGRLIYSVFESASPEGARRCLKDHGLLEDSPILQKGDGHRYSHATFRFFKTAACNLIPGIMNLPAKTRPTWKEARERGQNAWRIPEGVPISSISRERYSGPVYSLDVEVDHSYVSGGIILANCANLVDFDDMVLLVNRRASEQPEWTAKLQSRFHHVLMDEAQDTSKCQWELANSLLAPSNLNFYVVGDQNQAIYSFQGADPIFLGEFSRGWRSTVPDLYRITRNHRSLPSIIRLANKIQGTMTESIPLHMLYFRGLGPDGGEAEPGLTRIIRSSMPSDIAAVIAKEIQHDSQLKKAPVEYRDNAILVRSAIQVRDVEGALVRLRIPYIVRGGRGLLQTEEVKDILSYFRLAVNHKDFPAFVRAVGVPKRGIGDVAIERLRSRASEEHGGDLVEACASMGKLDVFYSNMSQATAMLDDPAAAMEALVRLFGYKDYISGKYRREESKARAKHENIDRFLSLVQSLADEGRTSEDLVFHLAMDRPSDDGEEEDKGAVTVSTIHSAKGLEWRRVYLTNVTEGSLPHRWCLGEESSIEEERRLWYVACTRARDNLTICVHNLEPRGPNTIMVKPSRFLQEVGIV